MNSFSLFQEFPEVVCVLHYDLHKVVQMVGTCHKSITGFISICKGLRELQLFLQEEMLRCMQT